MGGDTHRQRPKEKVSQYIEKKSEELDRPLYVSDLDGTLMGEDARISATSRRMLNKAIAQGTLFTIATARTPATVAELLEGVDLSLDAIVMTGAARWNAATGLYSHVKHFPASLANTVMNELKRRRFPAFIYTLVDNLIHIYRLGPMTPMEKDFIAWREHTPFKRVEFDTSESGDVWEQPLPNPADVVLIYSLQPLPQLEEFIPHITSAAPDANTLHYVDYDLGERGLGTLEMFAPGATKANAVRELAAELGVQSTVVFGDNVNDISMMRSATVAVAPANAIEQVKTLAHTVIGPNSSDAVARYILSHCR